MRVEGYGSIRFGDEWPVCFDLVHEPHGAHATIWNRPLEHIIQVRMSDNGDQIGIFSFRYSDDLELPVGWQNGKMLYQSEGVQT